MCARRREAGDPIGTHVTRCEAAGDNGSGAGDEIRRRQGRKRRPSQMGHHFRTPKQPLAQGPAKLGKLGSTREKEATRLSVAATPNMRDLLHPCAPPGQGSDKERTGKSVGRATQVVPGTSLRAHASPTHASPTRQQNPSNKSHPPHRAPTIVSQDAAPIPPGTKDLQSGQDRDTPTSTPSR